MEIMKNILLVFQHSIEFDFIRVILTTLGFNALSLHKSSEVRSKLKTSSPDLVITTSLATKDETLVELISTRQTTGKPKFIWVGAPKDFKKISKAQSQLIDNMIATPIQPDRLIEVVCDLLGVPADEYVRKYHEIQSKNSSDKNNSVIRVTDKERKKRYEDVLTRVENLDRTFSMKNIAKRKEPNPSANSPDLQEKKKDFVKALFGKK